MRLMPFAVFLFLCFNAIAADTQRPSYVSQRISQNIKIDGQINEMDWHLAPGITDFKQQEPFQNINPSEPTLVKIIYNDDAIYISAQLCDTKPDSIQKEFSVRDKYMYNDWFSVSFDTYYDFQNTFTFGVTAAGVQFDEKANTDNFDAIWESAVKITQDGWNVEMKIPYSAIRFPNKNEQKWGVQILRNIRRKRELLSWPFIEPTLKNRIAYFGDMVGITQIKAPLRLSLTPYLGLTENHYPANSMGQSNFSSAYNAGLDLKYGINDSYTLDLTLAPDFGQVQSDNKILNLSAFEVQYQENRPFFIEGTELFNVGNLFYPRRIGGTPKGFASVENMRSDSSIEVLTNPGQVQLINATKVTGRSPSGLGIGFLNAITSQTEATIRLESGEEKTIVTEPFSNYNIISFNQTLKHNSFISFMNTNVTRQLNAGNANVSAVEFAINDKKDRFKVNGFGAYNRKTFIDSISDGFRYAFGLEKVSGKFKFALLTNIESDTYNPNDLALLQSPDEITHYLNLSYQEFKPSLRTQKHGYRFNSSYSTTFRTKQFQSFDFNASFWNVFKNFFYHGVSVFVKPIGDHDIYEPRTIGRKFIAPNFMGVESDISSDYRKRLAIDASAGYFRDFTAKGKYIYFNITPMLRVSNRLRLSNNFSFNQDIGGQGFAAKINDDLIYFAFRNVRTQENLFSSSYIFNKNTSLTLRLRYYWSTVSINRYMLLNQAGNLIVDTTNYQANNNRNVSFFNADLVYSWRFAPGSDLIIVWKNNVSDFGNLISNRRFAGSQFAGSLVNTFAQPQNNQLTLKVLYYLDYRYFMKKKV